MEAINSGERTTSLINFIFVYVIILAIPLYLAFWSGTRRNSGGGSTKAVNEQVLLSQRMERLQQSILDMKTLDKGRPSSTSSSETWTQWLSDAEGQNETFNKEIDLFRESKEFTEARNKMRQSACTYLDMVHYERSVHLENLKALRGNHDQVSTIQQLNADKQQLQSEKTMLQNQVNTLNAVMARQGAGSGSSGGGGQEAGVVADLKWQLRFKDADCNKKQADLLAAYHEAEKRKKLYASAKVNFQQIAQLARNSYMLQQSATEKVREIDQRLSSL